MAWSTSDRSGRRGFQAIRERVYAAGLFAFALLSVLVTVAIVLSLLVDAVGFFESYSAFSFFTGTEWSPRITPVAFGVLPLVFGTLAVTVTSAAIAVPIGTLTALFLSEYAEPGTRSVLKPALEILAGIPTVVYGYLALVYVTPALSVLFPSISTFNVLSASIMVGIMIIPMVSSISEDAMSAVPDALREASYGLGATKYDVSVGVVVPAALSGILSSYILALSRAIGETMIVVMAMGMQPTIPPLRSANVLGLAVPYVNPGDVFLGPGGTMTAAMVQLGLSDVTGGSIAYNSLFAIGLTLFAITLAMNLVSDLISRRYREVY